MFCCPNYESVMPIMSFLQRFTPSTVGRFSLVAELAPFGFTFSHHFLLSFCLDPILTAPKVIDSAVQVDNIP